MRMDLMMYLIPTIGGNILFLVQYNTT